MPQFDGLGLTSAQQNLAMFVFAAVLAGLWAWSRWSGMKTAPVVKEFAFAGALSDMQPIRDLVAQFSEIVIQIKRIADKVEDEIDRRQRERDADDAASRREREPRQRDRDADEAAATRRDREPRPRKPPPVSRGQS